VVVSAKVKTAHAQKKHTVARSVSGHTVIGLGMAHCGRTDIESDIPGMWGWWVGWSGG